MSVVSNLTLTYVGLGGNETRQPRVPTLAFTDQSLRLSWSQFISLQEMLQNFALRLAEYGDGIVVVSNVLARGALPNLYGTLRVYQEDPYRMILEGFESAMLVLIAWRRLNQGVLGQELEVTIEISSDITHNRQDVLAGMHLQT